jgi:two-component system OmpR family sensor kinase/two-component system sensor histidine kinase BaeS
MWNHLWFKLTGAFALVTLVGVIVTALLTRQGAASHFAHFMVNHQMVRPQVMVQTLADHYAEQQGWDIVRAQFPLLVSAASDGMMSGMMGNMMGMHENRLQVVDRQGRVVADTADPMAAAPMQGAAVQRWPVFVNGQEVGALLAEGVMMTASPLRNAQLLQGVTRAVWLAGVAAGLLGILLAWLFVRQITRPLATLTAASARIADGDLAARVAVASGDELGTLAATFNRMAANLQTQETVRRNLMADVAHELRTPLTGIQGTLEAIQDGVFPLTQDQIGAIHDQVLLLNRLVDDLRTLAHAEAGQLHLDCAPLDPVELCANQVRRFQAQADAQQITLSLQGTEPLPPVHGDAQRLAQVLNNLLSNALRHTPPHGTVAVAPTAVDAGLQITITDSGDGIAPADLPHLFDRFYRTDQSRNRQTGGSGLGLAIARQLVEAHGGCIWAESPPAGQEQGSRFTLLLPHAC